LPLTLLLSLPSYQSSIFHSCPSLLPSMQILLSPSTAGRCQ
jgi:hypothetical protein